MQNPLLAQSELPQFSKIQPKHIEVAISELVEQCKTAINNTLASEPKNYAELSAPINAINDQLDKAWSPVSHMNSVVSNDALREAHDACLPILSQYSTFVGQHAGLYQAYTKIQNSDDFNQLSIPEQTVITQSIRDFTLSGIGLAPEKQARFAEVKQRLSELSSQFSNHLMDATLGWFKQVKDEAELSGLPESAKQAAKQAAESKSLTGWVFTLDIPSYLPVMMYADNATLREEMYFAYTTRASDQGPNAGTWDNSPVMNEILALRHELANLLGFEHYGEYSLATKMADKPEQVIDFIHQLAKPSRQQAQKEFDELKAFAAKTYGKATLSAWDIAYYSEKLKQAEYAISDEELRPYFPENVVVKGLFSVVNKLFGLRIEQQADIDTWHENVAYYHIYDDESTLRGAFYLDLYAREKKRGGAWMDECQAKFKKMDGSLQLPVAYLTCNFNGPVGDTPALFTHDEVVTLFHEFGHGLHHMLTQISVAGVSGINGVPWDAVELPSQFLENWCWEPEAIRMLSGHYESGEPLPDSMLEKLLAARNFQSAMQMVRQLEFSLFDFLIHQRAGSVDTYSIQETLDEVRGQISVVTPPSYNRFQHSFGHIFGGGYAAGYYSYKWAEVLSSDAYSRFEEDGIFNYETGRDFLVNILEKGGSEDPMTLFTRFRGRAPTVDALLRHSGITG